MVDHEDVFQVETLAPGVHLITEAGHTHSYLVEGRDRALLIDSGLGMGNIKAVAEGITAKPVIVVNTHAHWEHIGGNHLFDTIAIHSVEAHLLEAGISADEMHAHFTENPHELSYLPPQSRTGTLRIAPSQAAYLLSHGEAIDLGGGRILETLHTPGHSAGSICLLDETNRMLFTGDTVHTGLLQAHRDGSDLGQYIETAKWLYAIGWDTNLVFPGHGETPLDGGFLLEVGSGFERLVGGEGIYQTAEWRGGTAYDVKLGRFSIRIPKSLRR